MEAIARYDNNEFEDAIRTFDKIADTSKILFNLGVIHATLGEHPEAIESYRRSLKLDPYLAIAYFQSGVSNFLMGNFEDALRNFNDALLWLRGNPFIDYEQLQLKYKLYTAEILFNRGLCYIFLRKPDLGMHDLYAAQKEKITEDHDVIDEAIRDQAEGYTVFSIPVGTVYRPPEVKVKNLGVKDYLGKARLIATSDRSNTHTAFAGVENLKSRDPNVAHQLHSSAASAQHRTRQQSEPPVMRSAEPVKAPEPPRPSTKLSPQAKRELIASLRLDNLTPASVKKPAVQPSQPLQRERKGRPRALDQIALRHGTTRTASEPRTPKDFASIKAAARKEKSGLSEQLLDDEDQGDPKMQDPRSGRSRLPPMQTGVSDRNGVRDHESRKGATEERGDGERTRIRHVPRSSTSKLPQSAAEEVGRPTTSTSKQVNGVSRHEYIDVTPKSSKAPVTAGNRTSAPGGTADTSLKIIRVKLRAEDVRYIMVPPSIVFERLQTHVREKLRIKGHFKMRIKDEEGEVITLGDQEDLDAFIISVREVASKEKVDTGKAEIWVKLS